ncbi:hypothetical protein ACQPYE_19835 [Actinosynnema sp. CA-299493]
MADEGNGSKAGPEKVKLYGTVISAVSSLIAIAVFLGWDDDIKKAIPFAHTTTTAPIAPPIPAAAQPGLPEVAGATAEETTTDDETTTDETTTTTETPSPEELRQAYIRQADAACAPAIESRPARVATLDYGYMMSVLESRNRMAQDWGSVVVEPRDAGNYSRIQQLWNDFHHASTFWNYMADALLAHDSAAFDAELERYRASTTAFVNGATRYGFTMCAFGWNSVSD